MRTSHYPQSRHFLDCCDEIGLLVLEEIPNDESTYFTKAVVCSNCDHLKFYQRINSVDTNRWELIAELDPDREEFQYLKYAPFVLDRTKLKQEHRHT